MATWTAVSIWNWERASIESLLERQCSRIAQMRHGRGGIVYGMALILHPHASLLLEKPCRRR
jgi:hypothetical protein